VIRRDKSYLMLVITQSIYELNDGKFSFINKYWRSFTFIYMKIIVDMYTRNNNMHYSRKYFGVYLSIPTITGNNKSPSHAILRKIVGLWNLRRIPCPRELEFDLSSFLRWEKRCSRPGKCHFVFSTKPCFHKLWCLTVSALWKMCINWKERFMFHTVTKD